MSFDLRIKIPHNLTKVAVKAKLEYAFKKHREWRAFVTKYKVKDYEATFTVKVFGYTCHGMLTVEDEYIMYELSGVPSFVWPFQPIFIKEVTKIAATILGE